MRRLVLGGIGVVVLSVIVWWWWRSGESARPVAGDVGSEPAAGGTGVATGEQRKSRRMVSPVAPEAEANEAPKPGTASSIFRIVCEGISPLERCRDGKPLAARCDAGDVAACVATAELFFVPPAMPNFGLAFLARACKLGDQASCVRHRRHLTWFEWPKGQQPGDVSPGEACQAGDMMACHWATFLPSVRGGDVNVGWALKACEAGIVDSCGTVAERSDVAGAVRVLDLACRNRSPLHCGILASMYDDGTVCCQEPRELDDEGDPVSCVPCPDFDRTRAEGYAAQVLALTGKPYEPRYEDEPRRDDDDE